MNDLSSEISNRQSDILKASSKRTINYSPIPSNIHHSYSVLAPALNTYNSEWIDSRDNSPSKLNSSVEMTTTELHEVSDSAIHHRHETPTKSKASVDHSQDIESNGSVLRIPNVNTISSTNKASVTSVDTEPKVTSWEIFFAMINNITGKDKLAKFGQYTLRLLVYYSKKIEKNLSDEHINMKIIQKRYNNKERSLNLIPNFASHPADFIKIVIIIVCSIFTNKFSGMIKGLSTYRQFLRFGKTPFRIRNLVGTCIKEFNSNSPNVQNFLTNAYLRDILSLYYGINDEALLLYKLNVLSNPSVRKVVARHESLAWYYDSFFGLYNAYTSLEKLKQQEIDIKIQIQVKSRAKSLSRQILGGTSFHTFDAQSNDTEDLKLLKDIQFKKKNSYLDIYKWISDIIFNTYTVFHIVLPFDTLQIWMGISAATLSSIKLYRETKKRLNEQAIRKSK